MKIYGIMSAEFSQTKRGKKVSNGSFKLGQQVRIEDVVRDNCSCVEVTPTEAGSYVSFIDYGTAEGFKNSYCEG
jgi:hypothetical protein